MPTICLVTIFYRYIKRLQEEIDDTIGEKPVIDYKDLQTLTYLDMVVKETLRLYPPVHGSVREAGVDVTIGGIKIYKGTTLIVNNLTFEILFNVNSK